MPTKRAFLILLFALLLLLGAWVSKVIWFYLAFSVCVGLIIFSYILSHLLMFNVEIHREHSSQAYEDNVLNVSLKIRNRIAIFDQSIEILDMFTPAILERQQKTIFLTNLPRGHFEFSYKESCYKRGRYRLGPCRVKIFEPLGLFFLQKNLPVWTFLTVYPAIFDVRRLPFVLGQLAPRFGEQTTRISGDYEEFYGIREYHQEDGWRRIHWRSTARLAELMVRHFEQSSQWKAILVLDAHKSNNAGFGKETTFEYSVKVAASLAKYLLLKNASFGLIASTEKPLYRNISKGKSHFYSILEELAVIQADGNMSLPALISSFQWIIPPSSTLIVLSNSFDAVLIKLLRCVQLQKNTSVIPVIMNTVSFLAQERFQGKVKRSLDIKRVFSRVSSDVYFINCKDDLRLHFMC